MGKDRPLILISNDDGYDAKGINDLADMVRKFGDIIIMAPDSARSGAAMSITSRIPVRAKLIKEDEGLKIYSCSGTPADCVKIAIHGFLPKKPDLIIGGINHGDNSAVNALYSGTMAIAIEGAMKGISSIAFSSCHTSWDANFEPMRTYVERIVSYVLEHNLPYGTCLNVNAPAMDEFMGMKICSMCNGDWINEWEKRIDPRGRTYYWLTGSFDNLDEENDKTDKWALNNGYVAITPLKIDMTNYEMIKELSTNLQ